MSEAPLYVQIRGDSLIRRAELARAVLKSHLDYSWRQHRVWVNSSRRARRMSLTFDQRQDFIGPEPLGAPDWVRDMELIQEALSEAMRDFDMMVPAPTMKAIESWRQMIFMPAPSNQEVLDYA